MKSQRKTISKKVRYSVFARDGFTCRYCGKDSSSVQLVIDHVVPVCQGGTDEESNLATSCFDCNAGKGGKTPVQAAATEQHRLAIHQQLQEQLAIAKQAQKAAKARLKVRNTITDFYCEQMGVDQLLKRNVNLLASFATEHGIDRVFGWIETASTKVRGKNETDVIKYVCGIRRKQFRDEQEALREALQEGSNA